MALVTTNKDWIPTQISPKQCAKTTTLPVLKKMEIYPYSTAFNAINCISWVEAGLNEHRTIAGPVGKRGSYNDPNDSLYIQRDRADLDDPELLEQ